MELWFSLALIKWYKVNKRDLPWRHQNDAYFIWLSEIILQQTQVAQGLSYYNKFTQKYPKIGLLAKASEDEVLKLWQGLGYYSRARNLHATAKHIDSEKKGVFPDNFEDIKALKGVGDYTAAAIASFGFNLPHAVVDGNVYRVLSRIFGIQTPIDTSNAKKEFQNLANLLLNKKEPALHNQAIMEFGSQYCRPSNPDCQNCIFNARCFAFNNNMVAVLPVKIKKVKIRKRYFNYLVIADKNNHVLINRRGKNDIWEGLYEFNLIETPEETLALMLFSDEKFKTLTTKKFTVLHVSALYKHILTHQHLFARFYVLKISSTHKKDAIVCSLQNLDNLAFSRLTEKFLDDCVLKELF